MIIERKPRVFIGSSAEAIPYVKAVHKELKHVSEVTPWTTAFKGMKYPKEDLERQLYSNDFAVFICSPDDIIDIRGTTYLIPRDNTLFEMGLFWGRLGRERTFFLIPDSIPEQKEETLVKDFHLLSDLTGLNPLKYEAGRSDGNLGSAVSDACDEVISAIQEKQHFISPEDLLAELQKSQAETDAIGLFTLNFAKELMDNGRANWN
ncbi:TIR domain-containing protein [Niallia taxi]|uniref:TIR domain-containing protein n=1 Tax=Niallia taxi TaxID=2499688 RepID=UPI003D26AF05